MRKEKIKNNCLDMKVRISMENNLHNFDHIQVFYAVKLVHHVD